MPQRSVSNIKKELHTLIDKIDNKDLLQATLTILIQSNSSQDEFVLTDEELKILKKREADFLSGKDKGLTLDELKRKMNKKYGL
jgi:hypothetical protein